MARSRGFLLKTAVAIGGSLLTLGLMLGLVTGGADDAQRPHLLAVLQNPALGFVALYVVFSLLQTFFRAVRYRVLIRGAGETDVPSTFQTYLVTLVRNMLVDVAPARLGELSYIAMMNKRHRVSGHACVSSLTISFLFDIVALAMVMTGVILLEWMRGGFHSWMLLVVCVLAVISVIGVLCLYRGVRIAAGLIARLARRRHTRFLQWLSHFAMATADAIDASRTAGVTGRVLGLSLVVRAFKYTALYAIFLAVTVGNFPELATVPLPHALLAFAAAEAATSLPLPAFMSFGPHEAGTTLALSLMGFPAASVMIAGLAFHIWSQFVDYSLGAIGFLAFVFFTKRGSPMHTRTSHIASPFWQAAPRRRVALPLATMVLLGGIGMFTLQFRATKKLGALNAPSSGTALAATADTEAKQAEAMGSLRGFVVWSSNRNGNHDILKMTLPSRTISRLTTHPHVDYFPRISPDGRFIVFSRSQHRWVSQRNYVPWDVYLLDLKTGKETLLARDGNTPTWSEDGSKIYFQRNSDDLVMLDRRTHKETTVLGPSATGYKPGIHLETPQFNTHNKQIAVTLRGRRRAVGLFSLDGSFKKLGGGCELAWSPDRSFLYHVDNGGRQKNAFYKIDAATYTRTLWFDNPGTHSHEYFPKISHDGRYLVFGASTGGHEHDSADYEIFLWKIGDTADRAVRLTTHSGNDCWPDIFVEPGGRGELIVNR